LGRNAALAEADWCRQKSGNDFERTISEIEKTKGSCTDFSFLQMQISGTEAAELGLIDAVVSEPSLVLAKAIEMARQPKPPQTVLFRRLSESDVEVSEMLLQEVERRASVAVGVIHPKAAIDAIRSCVKQRKERGKVPNERQRFETI
jgi:enoyl-CoA hydratase/carnithine racemase